MTVQFQATPAELLSPKKRAQILQGAATVFGEDGYRGASMSRIAYAAGVSKATLYNHFESKSELFSEWTGVECERLLASVFDLRDVEEEVGTMLCEVGRRLIALMTSPTALLIYRMAVAEARDFPKLAAHFHKIGPERAVEALQAWLRSQTASGRLHIPDFDLAAQQFFALCQTRVVMQRQLGVVQDISQGEIDAVVEEAAAMFIAYYGAAGVLRSARTR